MASTEGLQPDVADPDQSVPLWRLGELLRAWKRAGAEVCTQDDLWQLSAVADDLAVDLHAACDALVAGCSPATLARIFT